MFGFLGCNISMCPKESNLYGKWNKELICVHKEQLIRHQNRTVDQALRESNKLMIMSTTKKNPEFTEGVSSFMESRPPNFSPFDPKNPMQTFKKEVLRDEQAVEDLPDTISKL